MPGEGWRAFRRFLETGGPAPRVALLVAHPDDETIGAGALLGRLRPEAVIHATDGAPRDLAWAPAAKGDREGYARERRGELERALSLVGVERDRLLCLGWVDQEAVLALPELAERLAALFLAFHREVAAGFLARAALFLHALKLDGKTLATIHAFREKETIYCYLQGFDPEFEKLSPGVLALGGVIEEAIREGATAIDFLRGQETYKYRWGAKDRETLRRQVRPTAVVA